MTTTTTENLLRICLSSIIYEILFLCLSNQVEILNKERKFKLMLFINKKNSYSFVSTTTTIKIQHNFHTIMKKTKQKNTTTTSDSAAASLINRSSKSSSSSSKRITNLLIDANTNKTFQLFYESELGFLIVTLLFDMLLEPFIMHFDMKHEHESSIREAFYFVLICCTIVCMPLVLFSYYAISSYRRKRVYILICVVAQLCFILIVGLKFVGLLFKFIPCFWNEKWITGMHFSFQLIIPIFSSLLLVGVYFNDANFLNNNDDNRVEHGIAV